MKSTFCALALFSFLPLGGSAAYAQDYDDVYPHRGVSLGGRATWFQADTGQGTGDDWFGGAQLRLHLSNIWALEGSADYRRRTFTGTRADIYPVQASLLAYLTPGRHRISPFILAGAGWYFTHVEGPGGFDETDNRFGPHVGGGLQIFLNPKWSIDATYRHIWIGNIRSRNASNTTANQDFDDAGHQVTAGLNFHF